MITRKSVEWREEFWDRFCDAIKDVQDLNIKAVLVQAAIADSGEKVRTLLKNESTT